MTDYDYRSWNLHSDTVDRLEQFREHERETQDDVVNNVLDAAKGDGEEQELKVVPVEDVVGREVPQSAVTLEATEREKIAKEVAEKLQ